MTHTAAREGNFKPPRTATQRVTNGTDEETDFTHKHTHQATQKNKKNMNLYQQKPKQSLTRQTSALRQAGALCTAGN